MDFSPQIDSWSADEVGPRGSRRRRRRPSLPAGQRARPPASFRRAFGATVGVLILLCAVLVVVAHGRGPTLSSTQIDTAAVTTTADQQLRLFANQSVSHVKPSQVSVTPRAPFTVQTAGATLTVQFTGMLRSATRYTVTVGGVTSVFGSTAASFSTSFTTAHASVLTLDRQPGGQDRIVRASVNAPGRSTVYSASRIQAFGAVGSDLVVVADTGAGAGTGTSSRITIVAREGTTEDLSLPGDGLVRGFALDAVTGIVSFTWTPVGEPSAQPRPYTIDLQGQHTSTLATGAAARKVLAAVASAPSRQTSRGTAQVAADGRTVTLTTTAGSGPTSPTTLATALSGQRFSRLSVSPNGQYISVVSAAADSASDGYTIAAAPVSPTTVVFDVASGATVATFSGSSLAW